MAAVAPVWLDGEGPGQCAHPGAQRLSRMAAPAAVVAPAGPGAGRIRRSQGACRLGADDRPPHRAAARGRTGAGRHPAGVAAARLRRPAEAAPSGRRASAWGRRVAPWHPAAFASFTSPIWQSYFDGRAFEGSLGGFEWRYPYLDLRVLEFMLSVPPVPWGWKKRLVREAMRGRLPAEVLARKKTPLDCYPEVATMRELGLPVLPGAHDVDRYVDPQFAAGSGRFGSRSGNLPSTSTPSTTGSRGNANEAVKSGVYCICDGKESVGRLERPDRSHERVPHPLQEVGAAGFLQDQRRGRDSGPGAGDLFRPPGRRRPYLGSAGATPVGRPIFALR